MERWEISLSVSTWYQPSSILPPPDPSSTPRPHLTSPLPLTMDDDAQAAAIAMATPRSARGLPHATTSAPVVLATTTAPLVPRPPSRPWGREMGKGRGFKNNWYACPWSNPWSGSFQMWPMPGQGILGGRPGSGMFQQ